VPTDVEMVMELINKPITCGVIKSIEDKKAKTEVNGKTIYKATGETRMQNEINAIFRTADGFTVTEIKGQLEAPLFKGQWAKKWDGQVIDNSTTKKAGVTAGAPNTAPTANEAADADSLFT